MYSTLALGKKGKIVKEETALRKKKEAVYAVMYMYMYTRLFCCVSKTLLFTQKEMLALGHVHVSVH